MDITGTGQTLGKEDFLRLFVTQMRNQNPLNPMDSTEFTAQLAQFSSLEQLTNMGSQLKDLLMYQNSLHNTLTTTLIGRKVTFAGDEIYLKGAADIRYSLPADADVKIKIVDSAGNVVREITPGPQKAGNNNYLWDGKDLEGNDLPEGVYRFEVEATDGAGNPVEVDIFAQGIVTGVTFEDDVTYLVIEGNRKIRLSDVKEIG